MRGSLTAVAAAIQPLAPRPSSSSTATRRCVGRARGGPGLRRAVLALRRRPARGSRLRRPAQPRAARSRRGAWHRPPTARCAASCASAGGLRRRLRDRARVAERGERARTSSSRRSTRSGSPPLLLAARGRRSRAARLHEHRPARTASRSSGTRVAPPRYERRSGGAAALVAYGHAEAEALRGWLAISAGRRRDVSSRSASTRTYFAPRERSARCGRRLGRHRSRSGTTRCWRGSRRDCPSARSRSWSPGRPGASARARRRTWRRDRRAVRRGAASGSRGRASSRSPSGTTSTRARPRRCCRRWRWEARSSSPARPRSPRATALEDGVNVRLVPPGDDAAFERALRGAARRPPGRGRRARRAGAGDGRARARLGPLRRPAGRRAARRRASSLSAKRAARRERGAVRLGEREVPVRRATSARRGTRT